MKRKRHVIKLTKQEKTALKPLLDRRANAYVAFETASRLIRTSEEDLRALMIKLHPKIADVRAILKSPKKRPWTIEYFEYPAEDKHENT